MYYVSYYSKPAAHIGMTEEDMQRNYERHHGKIITKYIEDESIEYRDTKTIEKYEDKIINLTNALASACNPFVSYHDIFLNDRYHTFRIPKRTGGSRTIEAPDELLKDAQRRLLKIFTKDMHVLSHNAAHGFVKGRNCKSALEVHQKNKSNWFLKLDIRSFFPSCTEELLKRSLKKIYPFCFFDNSVISRILWACTKDGKLVQGAPTSPFLANMCMLVSDYHIYKVCKRNNLIYTRYADDILLSSRTKIELNIVLAMNNLLASGLQFNTTKTRRGSCSGRNWNLGLMYNEDHDITVGYRRKKEVKHAVHNFETKEELQTHEEKYRLLGLIGYCKYIEPEYFQPYLDRVQAVTI